MADVRGLNYLLVARGIVIDLRDEMAIFVYWQGLIGLRIKSP